MSSEIKKKIEKIVNSKISGIWYLIKQIPFFFTAGATCTYVNVTAMATGIRIQRVDIIE